MRSTAPVVASEQKTGQQISTLRRFLGYLRPYRSELPVALMLVAGSETVRLIHDKQGRKEAIAFASHIVRLASQHLARPHQNSGKKQTVELEIDV